MGMSTHSIESFDETKAVSILKNFLESQRTIKTFFGENEKTPNHDGFFELINRQNLPQKQFIVQIKKASKLKKNVKGENKGKYVYKLKTNFLEYVKQKVTESPAIYFVVDIDEDRIFWLYLSDEVLMNMEFEGRETVSYPFTEDNIINDITSFTKILNHIVMQRNKAFLNKTKEEIAEMQETVEYLNYYLDHDLKAIKESVLPNLWRFGIKSSEDPGVSIGINNRTDLIECRNAVALYPQMKGTNDSGLKEYYLDNENIFNFLTFDGKVNLKEYSRDSLHKIIISFFENGIPAKHLPNLVLFEILNTFIARTSCFFDDLNLQSIPLINIKNHYMLLGKYLQYILTDSGTNSVERAFRNEIILKKEKGANSFFDISRYKVLKDSFVAYMQTVQDENILFSPDLFSYITHDYYKYLDALVELEKRNIDTVPKIWDYDWLEICKMDNQEYYSTITWLFNKLLSQMPSVYAEAYENIFFCNNYKITNRYLYKTEQNKFNPTWSRVSYYFEKFKSDHLTFTYNSEIDKEIWFDDNKDEQLIGSICGWDFQSIFSMYIPIYTCLCCLLYNGICDALEFETRHIYISFNNCKVGVSLF